MRYKNPNIIKVEWDSMNRIIVLDLEMPYGASCSTIHPVVLCDESHRVLVDCGCVGSLPDLEDALERNNLAPDTITQIILTHQDHDHVGAAAAFRQKHPQVRIMASAIEAPYISGVKKMAAAGAGRTAAKNTAAGAAGIWRSILRASALC